MSFFYAILAIQADDRFCLYGIFMLIFKDSRIIKEMIFMKFYEKTTNLIYLEEIYIEYRKLRIYSDNRAG